MKNRKDLGLLILRVGSAALLLPHGWGKVLKIFAGDFSFPDPLGIGPAPSLILTALAEFVCAVLVLVGFKTRMSALPPLIAMLVAALVYHAGDDFGTKEPALLYAVPFLSLALTGGGSFSLDAWLRKRG